MDYRNIYFEQSVKQAFQELYPGGGSDDAGDPPNFILRTGEWNIFRLGIIYRGGGIYSSLDCLLRNYLRDRSDSLTIVYGKAFGAKKDIEFPIRKLRRVIVKDRKEFKKRVNLVNVAEYYPALEKKGRADLVRRIRDIVKIQTKGSRMYSYR